MKKLHPYQIIDKNCKPYGGFVNVITKCGGTLVSTLWINSMKEYADQENEFMKNKVSELEHEIKSLTDVTTKHINDQDKIIFEYQSKLKSH